MIPAIIPRPTTVPKVASPEVIPAAERPPTTPNELMAAVIEPNPRTPPPTVPIASDMCSFCAFDNFEYETNPSSIMIPIYFIISSDGNERAARIRTRVASEHPITLATCRTLRSFSSMNAASNNLLLSREN
ncbi:MAG TPA: hypothetical protein EYP41_12235 [Anaerolineae bacterium]|nr:hypothetical protein [Anaerolineae bacterium]